MYRLTWPNRITILRILLTAPFVVALLHLQDARWGEVARRSAAAVFLIMAISDGLDGYLARRLKQESAAGRFLDPLADKLLILFSVLLLGHQGTHVVGAILPATVAVIVIGKDLVVVLGFCIIYFTTSRLYIEPSRLGKWCTTFQLLMVIAILISPDLPACWSRLPSILWWSASVLACATAVHYFQRGRRFLAQYEQANSSQTPRK